MLESSSGRPAPDDIADRQFLMRICSHATEAEMEAALIECGGVSEVEEVRAPEQGLVMLRGRIGGDGRPFNVGEATVTRAVVRLPDGRIGYSYLLGQSVRRARLAAIIDALGQQAEQRQMLETALIQPVVARRGAEAKEQAEETAATRVNFFTLVRGEDQP